MAVVSTTAPPEPSDEMLLQRYSRGDQSAIDELFRRHRALAYRVAYRLLGREADALDAVQEGFIKALTHLDGFQGRSSFKTWLLRVVSNAALDLGRGRSRREAVNLDSAGNNGEVDSPQLVVNQDPALGLEQAELRHYLNEALKTLPEAQRRTFVLYVDGGMNYREVAETLGISIGTVMSRLFYARQKLRACLSRLMKSEP
ncbi:MAG: hypothetical protein KatS3mg105_2681 [Gemmatales bacterium]|nr:MAG: hypothetical protein KatS3mg105_2681 [Gemmatales bacterium]